MQKRLRSTSKPSGQGNPFFGGVLLRDSAHGRYPRVGGGTSEGRADESSRLGSHADTAAPASLMLQVRAAQRSAARSRRLCSRAPGAPLGCTGTRGHRAASKRSPACGARRQRLTGGAAACACAPPLLQGRDRWPGVRHQLAGCSRVATPPEARHRIATASSSRSQHLPSASSCCTWSHTLGPTSSETLVPLCPDGR